MGKKPARKKRAQAKKRRKTPGNPDLAPGKTWREGTSAARILALLRKGGSRSAIVAKAKAAKITSDNLEARVARVAAVAVRRGLVKVKQTDEGMIYSAK